MKFFAREQAPAADCGMIFRFEKFSLDTQRRELRGADELVPVEPANVVERVRIIKAAIRS